MNHLRLGFVFFFQAEDGIRDRSPSRGLGDVYKRQVTFVVFNDIYYEGDTRTPEYSFAILQNTENGYSLMRLGMGEDLPTSDEVRLYSPFKTYNEMNWNINNVDNNNDVDFVKSYISIPILLLVISIGLIGLTACIVALAKRK